MSDVAAEHDADARYRAGRAAKDAGDLAAAERCYQAALALRPEFPDAWISLGILQRQAGRIADAAESQRRALALSPDHPLALLNLGNALFDLEEFAQAGELFRRVLQLNPRSAEAHNNLARVLWRDLDMQASVHWYQALQLRPDYFDAAYALGNCLFRAALYDDAARAYEAASRLQPENASVHLSVAGALLGARRYAAARERYEQLQRIAPTLPRAKAGLAASLAGVGQYSKPLALYREALAAAPDDPWIHGHFSQLLLRSGCYEEAWSLYGYRWRVEETREGLERGYPQSKWVGEPLAGRRLLVISEQGMGDEIMFASTFAEVIAEAAYCLIECDERLEKLFLRSFPEATFVGLPKGQDRRWYRQLSQRLPDLPSFDLWTAAGDLVAHRRRSHDAFPRHGGYLQADPARVAYWRDRLRAAGPGCKVGLSWRGGTPITNKTGRSMSLDLLAPLLREPGVQFVCLQYGECAKEIEAFEATHGVRILHFPEALADYDETAALVVALDLVISVCTAVVHLGGALGRPVWVMAPQVAEWRYGHQGPEMIWYPSVTVHRQVRDGDWAPVISRVRKSLRRML
jgi:tetratricopeptide (TPR) repeat protein